MEELLHAVHMAIDSILLWQSVYVIKAKDFLLMQIITVVFVQVEIQIAEMVLILISIMVSLLYMAH